MFLFFSHENSSFGVCGDDDLFVANTASSRNGKRQSMIPLRDNTDYEQSEKDEYEPDYDDDEYEVVDGAQYDGGQHNNVVKVKNDNEPVSDARPTLLETTRSETSTPMVSPTSTIGSTAIESCPKECACLNDFMDCIHMNLDRLPHVPPWVTSL